MILIIANQSNDMFLDTNKGVNLSNQYDHIRSQKDMIPLKSDLGIVNGYNNNNNYLLDQDALQNKFGNFANFQDMKNNNVCNQDRFIVHSDNKNPDAKIISNDEMILKDCYIRNQNFLEDKNQFTFNYNKNLFITSKIDDQSNHEDFNNKNNNFLGNDPKNIDRIEKPKDFNENDENLQKENFSNICSISKNLNSFPNLKDNFFESELVTAFFNTSKDVKEENKKDKIKLFNEGNKENEYEDTDLIVKKFEILFNNRNKKKLMFYDKIDFYENEIDNESYYGPKISIKIFYD